MPQTGTVARWLNHKGIGFITPDAGGDDLLVHHSEITVKPVEGEEKKAFVSLAKGEKVEYEPQPDPKDAAKMIASKVTGPDGAPVQGKPKGEKKEKAEPKKKAKAKAKADPKAKAKAKGGKKGAEAAVEEKRIDPEDKKAYTWEEMFAHYKKTYKKKELLTYWESCKLSKASKKAAKGGGKGEDDGEKRVDKDDGKAYTWEEMFAKYKKTMVKEKGRDALVAYWEKCKKGKAGKAKKPRKAATEKRIDPEDGAERTWEETFRKYKDTIVKEKGRAALVEMWKGYELAKAA